MVPKTLISKDGEASSKGKSVMKTREKRGKAKKSYKSYKPYIFNVLKNIHRHIGISNKAISIMESFIVDIKEKICLEAAELSRHNKKSTISSRDIESAVKLVLPGKLAKHAVHQGAVALESFNKY
ncbi:histone H2B.5-like [Bidens hawaiensis]|uniref:histone H2B.5-like n=1 Tax=Bidens hawaiensis TaxID=980011 RepID=UPI00404AD0BD